MGVPPPGLPPEGEALVPHVDVHLATPYGVTGHLMIPVVGPTCAPACGYRFAVPTVYTAKYTVSTTDKPPKYSLVPGNSLLPTNKELTIETPASVVAPDSATLTVTFTSAGKVLTNQKVAMHLDIKRNRYFTLPDEFESLRAAADKAVMDVFSSTNPPNPKDPIVVSGKFIAGSAVVAVDNQLTVSLVQQQP